MKTTNRTLRILALAVLTGVTLAGAGCAVVRDQQTVGAYIDDAALTTEIKAKFVESKAVDATAVKVETLNGTVVLSGFAKSSAESNQAESIARSVKGVRQVRNTMIVRP